MACIKTKVHVPLRWGNLLIVTFFFVICLEELLTIRTYPISPLHIYLLIYLIPLFIALIRLGVSYSICSEYLEARFMGIPFRHIKWNKLRKAIYLHAWKDIVPKYSIAWGGIIPSKRNSYGQIIYVTLDGCSEYCPERHVRFIHNILHPLRTACIWLPYSMKEQYLDAFKKCYPELEIQPIDAWKKM